MRRFLEICWGVLCITFGLVAGLGLTYLFYAGKAEHIDQIASVFIYFLALVSVVTGLMRLRRYRPEASAGPSWHEGTWRRKTAVYCGAIGGGAISASVVFQLWYMSIATACPVLVFMPQDTRQQWTTFFLNTDTSLWTGLNVAACSIGAAVGGIIGQAATHAVDLPSERRDDRILSEGVASALKSAFRQLVHKLRCVRYIALAGLVWPLLCGLIVMMVSWLKLGDKFRSDAVGVVLGTAICAILWQPLLRFADWHVERSPEAQPREPRA